MSRQKDYTPHTCNICKDVLPACGMNSHLYHKHGKMKTEEYVKKFGEFRRKYLTLQQKYETSTVLHPCRECDFVALTHKQLVQHIGIAHGDWQLYYIKHYFNGVPPTCKCGCGQKTKLIRHGRDDKRMLNYCRTYLPGHNTNPPGYRVATLEQRQNMREAAIKRMKEGNSVFHTSGPSKGELELHNFVKSLDIQAIYNDKTLLKGLEIDILIPDKKIAIEYNGSRFHSDLFKERKYHLKKTEELNQLGYHLVHIWEPDWLRVKDIVKSNLTHLLGKTENRYYARKLTVKEVPTADAVAFLHKNHLQGSVPAKIRLGLYTADNVLLSLMTFSNARAIIGGKRVDSEYELVRFCNQLNTVVIGGASKLFRAFVDKYSPKQIYTYANRDWSLGKLYQALGMTYQGSTPPGYFYVKSHRKYSRQRFQKHKLVAAGKDPAKTEYQIMTEDGYYRIWDCGNLKYIWKTEG
jgi:hypothetical protein